MKVGSLARSSVDSLLLLSALTCCGPALLHASDASYYGVLKLAQFQQSLTNAPTPLATNGYSFSAFVVASTNFAVTNATFKAPNSSTNRPLTLNTKGDELQYTELFQTQASLDSAYPSSTSLFLPSVYNLTMRTVHDGVKTGNANYELGSTPPTPQISNLAVGQGIDTTTSFTVQWTAMGGLIGLVQLLVLDSSSNLVYSSPAPFTTGALDQSSTSGTIAPNILPPGTNLTGHLIFAAPGLLVDTNSYPGATGIAALGRDTGFPLVTRSAPVQPRLQIAGGGAPWVVRFTGETNRNYHLQGATNVAGAAWVDLLVRNVPAASFTDTESAALPRRFYRVQVGP
jgi:hypothetical protein